MYFAERFRVRSPVLLLMVMVMVAGAANPGFAETGPVRIPGTKSSLVPPEGFVLAELFPGFEQESTASSIMVTEIEIPFEMIATGMTKEGMATRGMELLDSEEIKFGEVDGLLFFLTQEEEGVVYRKWLGIFGDDFQTVMSVGTFPVIRADELSAPIREAVLSTVMDPDAEISMFDGLTFRFQENVELKIANRMSNTLVLTRDGTLETGGPKDPLMIVGSAYREFPIDDVEEFTKDRIMQTDHVEDIGDIEGEAVTIEGSPGYELIATAKDSQTGIPMMLYLLVVARDDTYYLAQGLVGAEAAEKYMPEFLVIARSITFVN
jgi:hypothetical protein